MQKNKKWRSLLMAGALLTSLVAPTIADAAPVDKSVQNFNTEKYGDTISIDPYLDKLSKDEDFNAKLKDRLKAQASAAKQAATSDNDSDFTYDGGTKKFLTNDLSLKDFTLRSVGDNVEIWVAHDLAYGPNNPKPADVVTQSQVDKLRDEFESNIYPKVTDFFGTPDQLDGSNATLPSLVGLPKNYYEGSDKVILLVDNVQDEGWNNPDYPFFVAGFYWQTIENYINRNIVTIDTNNWETRLEDTFYGTTIHELQHLIQADHDSSEESWLNEGFSTFSEYLGGYGAPESSINFFLDHPENSLVNWDEHATAVTGPETIADYGQVYLFTQYLYDKFGHDFIKEIALDGELQGMESVDKALKERGTNFTETYQNFMTAVALDDKSVDAKYDIDSIDLRDITIDNKGTKRGKTVDFESAKTYEKEGVPAWGGDFKSFDFTKDVRGLRFNGSDFLPLQWAPVTDPVTGQGKVLWGGDGSEADHEMIFEADLTNATAPTLTFQNLYDIEEAWDYGVVQVSTDNGETWESLSNINTRNDVDPQGYPKIKDNVPGFTGTVDGWQNEAFSLEQYKGQKVLVSFRYLTDWGSEQKGWYVKDIRINEANVHIAGDSTEGLQTLSAINKDYVKFLTTFIQTKKNGKTKVEQVNPYDVTAQKALQINNMLKEGNTKMITSYAAKPGDLKPVNFTYEVLFKQANPNKGKGTNNGKGKGPKWTR
ncbi:immune inhibitor A domain-containing protein [Kurthia massiliensis]|uniref:immune inhibitor A domain-containing protein n=1 Tax=Kurthia massiliensis TaxID=1033739 RepID=UPI000289586D|nr:immune inhibitor A domain-containing protein [Kurthia massiliensis]